jgi:hypothetical protein
MNQYRQQALSDLLETYANIMFEGYLTAEHLNRAIEAGKYSGKIYETHKGKEVLVCDLRLEPGEGTYCIFEGSTWIVAWYDILNRWYRENKKFFDKEITERLNR